MKRIFATILMILALSTSAHAQWISKVQPKANVSHQWLNSLGANGKFTSTQPAFTDISGTAAASQLPLPTASTIGGIKSLTNVTHKWLNSIGTDGLATQTQPDFSDLSGTAAASQLPLPTATTIGAIKSLANVSHKWINSIGTDGLPTQSQPGCADLLDASPACAITPFPLADRTALRAASTTVGQVFDGSWWVWLSGDQSGKISSSAKASTNVNTSTNIVTLAEHGLTTGNAIYVTSSTADLALQTLYYIVFVDYDTFKLATSYDNALTNTTIDLTVTTQINFKRLYDPMQGVYVTPTNAIGGGSGVWQRQENLYNLKWKWFGADPYGSSYSDEQIAGARSMFDKAWDTGMNMYRAAMDPDDGIYKLKYSLNLSGIRGSTNGRAGHLGNVKIVSEATGNGSIAVDFTNTSYFDLSKMTLYTTSADYGYVFARAAVPTDSSGFSPAINMQWEYLQGYGKFKCTGFASIGAEVMHAGTIDINNNYYTNTSVAEVITGQPSKLASFCPGGLAASKYQIVYDQDSSMSGSTIDFNQASKPPAYTCTIDNITKAATAVATINNAGSCFDTANSTYGLVNDSKVWFGAVKGDDNNVNLSSWRQLSYHVFTVKSINTSAKTFQVYSEDGSTAVDTSGLTGSYDTSAKGTMSNDSGPAIWIARAYGLEIQKDYSYVTSSAPIVIDVSGGSGATAQDIRIKGRFELATPFNVRFIGDSGSTNYVKFFQLHLDQSNARDAYFDVTGSGVVNFSDLQVHIGNNAQNPVINNGIFANDAKTSVKNKYVITPVHVWTDYPYVLSHNATGWSHTGDVNETEFLHVDVPSPGPNGFVEVISLWSFGSGSGSAKTTRIRLNSTVGTAYLSVPVSTAGQLTAQYYTMISQQDISHQVGAPANFSGFGISTGNLASGSLGWGGADIPFYFTGQLASAGDTVKLERYVIKVYYSP